MPKHTEHKHIDAAPDKAPSQRLRTAILNLYFPASVLLGLHTGNVLAQIEGFQATDGGNSAQTQTGQHSVITSGIKGGRLGSGTVTSMNIHAGESLTINQINSNSHYLLKSTNVKADHIMGTLSSNGKVTLYSGNGLYFGKGAKVNVNSLTASGMDINVNDFLAGKLEFYNKNGKAAGIVVNQGLIEAATGGSVTLIGGAVKNEGVIMAHSGQVSMIAGEKVTMDFDGDGLIQFVIDKEVLQNAESLDSAVENTGTIDAQGGTVLLSGKASSDVFSNVVNNSGVIKAGRIDKSGGKVRLVGLGAGNSVLNTGSIDVSSNTEGVEGGEIEITGDNITNSGTLTANSTYAFGGKIKLESEDTTLVTEQAVVSATSEQAEGGEIQILGDKVGLFDEAVVDASGATGGGEVLIGGDFHGNNDQIKNSKRTFIDKNVIVSSDAIQSGDGGKVVVWADEITGYQGTITARGGEQSGNGGFVEVSGKELLAFDGAVDTTAANGQTGTLLLDPRDILIDGNTTDDGDLPDIIFSDDNGGGATNDDFQISAAAINTASASSNIILQANRDITQSSGQAINITSANSLVMQAGNNITLNETITTNGGGIHLEADSSSASGGSDGSGDIIINSGASISSGGGDITLIGEDFTISDSVNAGTGDIAIAEIDGPAFEIEGGGSPEFTAAELNQLTTSGTLFLGQATTAGDDGQLGTVDANETQITVDTISIDGNTTLDSDFTGTVSFIASDGIDLSAGSLTIDGATSNVTINADANNDGTGTLNINDTFTLTSGNNDLAITAADINLNTTGAITSGTSDTTITASNSRSIGLGATAGDLTIDDSELNRITAQNFNLNSDVAITVNGITAASTDQIAGVTTLSAGTNILFATGDSTFEHDLTLNIDADNDGSNNKADFQTSLTVNDGDINVNGTGGNDIVDIQGSNNIVATAGAISISNNISDIFLDTAGAISITAGGGAITLSDISDSANIGTLTLQAFTDVTVADINLNDGTPNLDIDFDTEANGGNNLDINGSIDVDGTFTADGGGGSNTVLLGTNAEISAGVGDVLLSSSQNISSISLDGSGNNSISSDAGTVNVAAISDAGAASIGALTINAAEGITTAGIVLDDAGSTGDLTLNLDTDDDAGADTLDINGTIDVKGALVVAGDSNTTADLVTLAAGADIIARTGNIQISSGEGISGISLDGTGDNIITSTAGTVSLAAITDNGAASIGTVTINAAEGITTEGIILDDAGSTGNLNLNLDTDDDAGADTLDIDATINVKGALSIAGGGTANDAVTLAAGSNIVAGTGDVLIGSAQNISGISLDGTGDNIITSTAGTVNLAAITDNGAASIGTVTINAAEGISTEGVTLDDAGSTGNLNLNLDTDDDAVADTLDVNGTINVKGALAVAGGGTTNDLVTLGAADIIVGTGNVGIGASQNISSISLDGAGSSTISSAAGSVSLASIDDTAAITELTIEAGTDITLDSVILDFTTGSPTRVLDLNLDTGGDGTQSLTVTGALEAGTIEVDGNGTNDAMNFGDGAGDTVTANVGGISINAADTVNFTDDISATTGVTISNINTEIDLAADVDITATTGNVDLNDTVTAIDLSGAGTNIITATAGAVELADVGDSADIDELEINAGTDITLANVIFDQSGTPTTILDIDLDEGADGSETLTVTGALTAGTIDIDAITGTRNDAMTFTGQITSTNGSVDIANANTVDIDGGVDSNTDLNIQANTISAEAGNTFQTLDGSIDFRRSLASTTFEVTGTGTLNIIVDSDLDGTDSLQFVDITDSSSATLDIDAGGSMTVFGDITMDGGGDLNIDVGLRPGTSASAVFQAVSVAGAINLGGANNNEQYLFNNTLQSTGSTVTVTGVNTITAADVFADSTINLDVSGGAVSPSIVLNGTSYTSNDGDITLTGDVDLDSTGLIITFNSDANDDATDGSITFNGAINDDTSGDSDLVIDADTGDVSMNAIGSTTQIGTLTVTGNDIVFNGNVESEAITVTAKEGGDADSIDITGVTLDANNSNMSFATDDFITGGTASLISSGSATNNTITITGETDASRIEIGDSTAGLTALAISEAELQDIGSTIEEIIIGVDTTQSGTIEVEESGGLQGLNSSLNLRSEAGLIDIDSAIDMTSTANTNLTFEGPVELSANLTTDSGDVTANNAVTVDGTVTVDSGNSGSSTTAGNVTFLGTIDSNDATGDTLTINAGGAATDGDVNIAQAVGGTTDLNAFTISAANQVDVNSVEVTSGNIAMTGSNIDLNGANYQTTTSGAISFTGAVDLDTAGAVNVATAGGAGDNITFSSTIVDDASGDSAITLNAGAAGNVTTGNIGGGTAVGQVDIDGAAISVGDISSDGADILVTGTSIDLNGIGYTANNSGSISFDGPVVLNSTAGSFQTAGGAGDDISFTSTIDDDAAGEAIVTLNAGAAGDVAVAGAIGGITRVRQVDIDALEISVDSIRVDGVSSGAANIFIGTIGTTTLINLDGANYDSINSATSGIIRIDGPTVLTQGAASTTTISSTSGANSDITFRGTIDDNVAGNTALVVDAGAAGDISFQQAVGDTTEIASMTISNANQLDVVSVETTGAHSYSAGNIDLNGTTYSSTTSGTIVFNNAVDLFTDVTVTSAGGAGNNINFLSTIDSNDADGVSSDRSLSLVAGAGNVSVTGAIGGTEALDGGVTISGATINTGAITTDGADAGANKAGGAVTIDATGGTITVGAISATGKGLSAGGAVDIDADGTNAISVQGITTSSDSGGGGVIELNNDGLGTGVVTLNDNLTTGTTSAGGAITLGTAAEIATGITLSTGVSTGDITFDSTLDSEASENNTLGITAGTGSLTFTGAVGSGLNQELGAITINSANGVTSSATLEAASFTQSAGTGITQLGGQIDVTAAGTNINITTTSIDVDNTINTNGGNVVLNSVSGVTLDGGNIVTSGAVNAADTSDNAGTIDIDVTAAGAVALSGNLDASGAASNASAAGDGALVTINTFDGSITVADINTSGGAGTGQNGGDAAQIQITAGDNGGSNGDNITIGSLSARGGTGTAAGTDSSVTLTAIAGAVIDGNGATTNIDATSLVIDARDGIGNGDALETVVESFDIDNTNSNNVEIVNAAIASATVTKINNATAGAINFTQTGNQLLTLTSLTAGDGSITISNTGGTTADINIGSITADTTNDVVAIISSGAIEDGASDTATDITARTITLNAADGVGAAEELETTSAAQTATSTNGNIDIDNTAVTGAATVVTNLQTGSGSINYDQTGNESLTINAASTTDGSITIRNTGDANTDVLTIGGAITAGGTENIQLTTITRGDISVDNNLTATSDTITVDSSDDITLGNAIAISTGGAGQVNLNVDVNGDVAATLDLGTGSTITSADINFDGNATGNDTLAAQDVANTWVLTGSGTLDNANLTSTAVWTDFANIEGGTNTDTVDQTNASAPDNPIAVVLSSEGTQDGMAGSISGTGITTTNFDNIDEIFTDQTGSTLTGAPSAAIADATWTIDGVNENYTDDASGQDLDFSGSTFFTTLTGGTGNDTFNITESYTGDIAGGDGTNVYNLSSTTGDVLTGNITGGAGADTFNFGTPTGAPPGTSDYTITGNVVGGGGSDTIDFSGSVLVQRVTLSSPSTVDGIIQDEPLSADPPDADLIGGSFSSIENLVGNSQGSLLGPNVATFWNITGSDSGTYGNTLANIGDQTFNNLGVIAGSADDLIVFQNGGELTLGFDGGGGTNTLAGSLGIDTFDITGATSVDITVGGNTTVLLNINNIDGANATDDGTTTVGDTGVDTFNINNDWTGTLAGAGGNDIFDLAEDRTVGSIQGGAGTDTLDAGDDDTANTISVTGGNADGNDGSFSDGGALVSAFTGIDIINTGDGADTYNIQAVGATLVVNAGDGGDTFNVSSDAPTNTGNLNGIGATISLNGDANTAGSDVLNLFDTSDATDNNGTITSTTITGLGMTGGVSYSTLEDININLGSGNDGFTISSTSTTVDVNTGAGNDTVNINNISNAVSVTDGAGDDTYNVGNGDVNTNLGGNLVTITAGDDGSEVNGDTLVVDDSASAVAETYFVNQDRVNTNVGGETILFSPSTSNTTMENLTINAGTSGTDIIDVVQSTQFGGDVIFNDGETVKDTGGSVLTANKLTINNATTEIGQFGVNVFNTDINTLEVSGSGVTTITEANDIELSDINIGASNLTLIATTGSITNAAADSGAATTDDNITTTGAVQLTAGGAGEAVGASGNKINFDAAPSSITAIGSGGVFLNQTAGIMTINGINAGTANIELMSANAITEAGNIAGGTLIATSGGAITLNNSTHSISGFTATSNGAIQLDNNTTLSLNTIDSSGTNITVTNAAAVGISGLVDSGAGDVSITTSAGGIQGNGGTIDSTNLNLSATTGIGTTTVVDTTTTGTIALTTAGTGTAGNASINETNGFNTSVLNLASDGSNQTFTITSAGTININDADAGTSSLDTAGTKQLDAGDTLVLDSTFTGPTTDIVTANVGLRLNGNVSHAGITSVNTGTGRFDVNGNLTGGNDLTITSGRTAISGNVTAADFTLNSTGVNSFGGSITLSDNLDVNSTGATSFAGNITADDILLDGTSSSFSGNSILQSRNNIINLNNVTGTGALQIRTAAVDDVINIATSTVGGALNIRSDEFSGFSGELIIGGSVNNPIPNVLENNTEAGDITVDASLIDIQNNFNVGTANLTLLADSINVTGSSSINAGDEFIMVAQGSDPAANSNDGDITFGGTGGSPNIIDAGNTILVAENTVNNLSGARFIGDTISVSVDADQAENVEDPAAGTTASPADPSAAILSAINNALGFAVAAVDITIPNPASALIGLQEIAFIDVGLFEEELTLFGIIGNGIALSLAQCEEVEGCAPNVTEEELNELIAGLEARINELNLRLADANDAVTIGELTSLVAGFEEQLNNYRNYLVDLKAFLEGGEEEEFAEDFEEDFETDFDADFSEDIPTAPADVATVESYGKMLETVNNRIAWLESLKTNPDERARLSEQTGIDLTLENLELIIEASKQEAGFIENQIKLLLEGTEALLPKESPKYSSRDADENLAANITEQILPINGRVEFTGAYQWQ